MMSGASGMTKDQYGLVWTSSSWAACLHPLEAMRLGSGPWSPTRDRETENGSLQSMGCVWSPLTDSWGTEPV